MAFYRHTQTEDVTARAYLLRNHHRSSAFPVRSDVLGAGVVCAF